jgi:hypothetical protein
MLITDNYETVLKFANVKPHHKIILLSECSNYFCVCEARKVIVVRKKKFYDKQTLFSRETLPSMTELFSKMMDPDPRGYEKEENDLIIFFN